MRPLYSVGGYWQRRSFWTCPRLASHIGSLPIPLPASVICQSFAGLPTDASSTKQSFVQSIPSTSSSPIQNLQVIRFSGPLGQKDLSLPTGISAHLERDSHKSDICRLLLTCSSPQSRKQRSQWGLFRALSANAVQGVSEGFTTGIRLVGVGYRAALEDVIISQSDRSREGCSQQRVTDTLVPENTTQTATGSNFRQYLVLRLGFPRPIRFLVPSSIRCRLNSPTDLELRGQDLDLLGHFAAQIRRWRKPEPYNGKGVYVGDEKVRRKEVKKK